MFFNPLSMENFSDPFITYDKQTGYYYFIASCQCNSLTMYRSKNVGELLTKGEKRIFIFARRRTFGARFGHLKCVRSERSGIYTRVVVKALLWDGGVRKDC